MFLKDSERWIIVSAYGWGELGTWEDGGGRNTIHSTLYFL